MGGIQIWYEELPEKYRQQTKPIGGHAITVDAVSSDGLWCVDPIPRTNSGYVGEWIPETYVKRAAERLAGPGRVYMTWTAGQPSKPPQPVEPDMPGPIFNIEGTRKIGVFTFNSLNHAMIRASDNKHVPVTAGNMVRNIYCGGFLTTTDGKFTNEPAYLTEVSSEGQSYYVLAKDGTFVEEGTADTKTAYNLGLTDAKFASGAAIDKLRK
jgi:hypothetical protein